MEAYTTDSWPGALTGEQDWLCFFNPAEQNQVADFLLDYPSATEPEGFACHPPSQAEGSDCFIRQTGMALPAIDPTVLSIGDSHVNHDRKPTQQSHAAGSADVTQVGHARSQHPAAATSLLPPTAQTCAEGARSMHRDTSADYSGSDAMVTGTEEACYAGLLFDCLRTAPEHTRSLQDIYKWFQLHTSKAHRHKADGSNPNGWMNSIRHNLSLNAEFVNLSKTSTSPRKFGRSLWQVSARAVARGYVESTTSYRNAPKGKPSRRAAKDLKRQQSGAKGGRATKKKLEAQRHFSRQPTPLPPHGYYPDPHPASCHPDPHHSLIHYPPLLTPSTPDPKPFPPTPLTFSNPPFADPSLSDLTFSDPLTPSSPRFTLPYPDFPATPFPMTTSTAFPSSPFAFPLLGEGDGTAECWHEGSPASFLGEGGWGRGVGGEI